MTSEPDECGTHEQLNATAEQPQTMADFIPKYPAKAPAPHDGTRGRLGARPSGHDGQRMATPVEAVMFLDPQDIARRIEHKHGPGWVVWYGRHTRHYWALATWVPTSNAMFGAATPDALDAAITTFEMLHPRPRHRPTHAMAH